MTRNIFIVTIFTMLFTSLIGCATTTLVDYKAKTTDEEEIKTTLLNYSEALRDVDAEKALSFYHEDARIMYDRLKVVVSKQQFSEILPTMIGKFLPATMGTPKMNVKGDEAIVKVPLDIDVVVLQMTYNLVRENGKWYIMSNNYFW